MLVFMGGFGAWAQVWSKGLCVGKLENLVPQYLRSGIEIFSHQIYASTISLDCLINKQQFIGFCNIKINGAVWSN